MYSPFMYGKKAPFEQGRFFVMSSWWKVITSTEKIGSNILYAAAALFVTLLIEVLALLQ
jgi:hypothetical protein